MDSCSGAQRVPPLPRPAPETGKARTAPIGSHTPPETTADVRKIAKQTGISGPGRKTIPDSGKRLVRGETALRETARYEERHSQGPARGLRPRQLADRLHAHPHRGGSSFDLSLAWTSSSRLKCWRQRSAGGPRKCHSQVTPQSASRRTNAGALLRHPTYSEPSRGRKDLVEPPPIQARERRRPNMRCASL